MTDIVATAFFSVTSLIWWSPILAVIFFPFYIWKKMKRKLAKTVVMLEDFSEFKLDQLRKFKRKFWKMDVLQSKALTHYNKISDSVYQKMVWYSRFEIIKAVPRGARVLDVGCGNGYLAKLLKDTKGAEVTCLDVMDYNKSGFETVLYDGETIPFGDKSFDIVLLSYVLHHSHVPQRLLSEAARVCRGKVLIYEDLAPIGKKVLARLHKEAYNYIYSIDSPVNYRSQSEWKEIFDNSGLKVVSNNIRWGVGSVMMPLKSAFFALENKN
ncbi:methyltransferase domain-containing protein [Candidatus Gottesmanbacteria bacterium]|nr:methyltransferase domain-containing protein [Candidatus Gottesmanbacteria bacterium]